MGTFKKHRYTGINVKFTEGKNCTLSLLKLSLFLENTYWSILVEQVKDHYIERAYSQMVQGKKKLSVWGWGRQCISDGVFFVSSLCFCPGIFFQLTLQFTDSLFIYV